MPNWTLTLWRTWQRYSIRRKLAPYEESIRQMHEQAALACMVNGHNWQNIPGLGVVCALCGKAKGTA